MTSTRIQQQTSRIAQRQITAGSRLGTKTIAPRGRLAEAERLRRVEIAKKIRAAKIHNAKIQPERAESVIKALVLKEARTTIQAKIKYLEDKIERYGQKEREAKRKDQDDRARKYDDRQEEYGAELREYQRVLGRGVHRGKTEYEDILIKDFYSGKLKATADYKRKVKRADNRNDERARDAKARAKENLQTAMKNTPGSFIGGGILFDGKGGVVTDSKGYVVTDGSSSASKIIKDSSSLSATMVKQQSLRTIKDLEKSKLKPIVRDGIVVGFSSPITRKSYRYTNKGIDAFNKELGRAGKPVDLFRGVKVKATASFVADAALKYKYNTLARVRAAAKSLNITPTKQLTELQEKRLINKAKNILGKSFVNTQASLISQGVYSPRLPEKWLNIIEKREKAKPDIAAVTGSYQMLTLSEIKQALREKAGIEKKAPKEIELINEFDRAVRDAPPTLKYDVQKNGLKILADNGIKSNVTDGMISFTSKHLGKGKDISTYSKYSIVSKSKRVTESAGTPELKEARRALIGAKMTMVADKAIKSYASFAIMGGAFKAVSGLKILKHVPSTIKMFGKIGMGVGATGMYGTSKVLSYQGLVAKYGKVGEEIFWAEVHGELLGLATLSNVAYLKKIRKTKIYNQKQQEYYHRKRIAIIEKKDYAKIRAGKGELALAGKGRKIGKMVTIGEQNKIADVVAKTLKISKAKALAKIKTVSVYRQIARIKSDSGSARAALAFKRTGKASVGKKYLEAHRYGISFTERVGNTVKNVAIEFNLRGKKAVNLGLKVSTGKGKYVGTEVFAKARARKGVDFPEFKRTGVYVSKIIKGKNGKIMLNRNVEAQLSNIQIRQATFGGKPLSKTSRVSLNNILKRYSGEIRLNKVNSLLKRVYTTLGKEAKKADFQILRLKGKNTNIFVEFGKGKGAYPTRIGILKSAIKRMKFPKGKPKRITIKGGKMIRIKPIRNDIKLVPQQSYKQSLVRKVKGLSTIQTKAGQQAKINKQLNLQAKRLEQVSKSIYAGQPRTRMPSVVTKPIFRDAITIMSAIALKSASSVALSLKKASKNLSKSKVIQKTEQKQLTKTLTDLKQLQEIKTSLILKGVTISPGVVTVIVAVPGSPKPRKIPPQKIVKMGLPFLPKGFTSKNLSKKQPTYRIVVKVRGKPISKLPREMTKNGARDFLAYEIDNTLTRSGWLEPTGQSKRVAIVPRGMRGYYGKTSKKLRPYKIRKGKKKKLMDAYIEKAKYFQDTAREKAQVARLRSKRRVKKRIPIKRKPVRRKVVRKRVTRKPVRRKTARRVVRRKPVKGRTAQKRIVKRKVVKRKRVTRKPVRRKTTKRKTIKR